jgi:dTDP-4-dehydrorhamnose 3,5-epimerase
MIFEETGLKGLMLIRQERHDDDRGYFARTMCQREFEQHGIPTDFVQCNISYNKAAGTLRGMHYQLPPGEEGKLIRCSRGRIYDINIDLRENSTTYLQWRGYELSHDNGQSLYVPPGFAHGFVTLEEESEVFYMMTEFYQPELAAGVRWNDPAFSIQWPVEPKVISERDEGYADFQ